ncbi:MAG: hypothetical protein VKK97_11165 [Synechococcaceae cyanobacterium]|nr:hypothetical protein [Synechococcaceae cyanobacterium]
MIDDARAGEMILRAKAGETPGAVDALCSAAEAADPRGPAPPGEAIQLAWSVVPSADGQAIRSRRKRCRVSVAGLLPAAQQRLGLSPRSD